MYNNESQETVAAPDNLLACFFAVCEREFRFLEQRHGFNYFSGLAEYKNGREILHPCDANTYKGDLFQAATLYDSGKVIFEIHYGGENFKLDFHLCYGRVDRLSFAEIIRASRRPFLSRTDNLYASDPAALEQHIRAVAQTVRKNINLLTDPDQKIIQRALQMREKLQEQKIFEIYRHDMNEARTLAAKAFLAKDYVRVIRLLIPYERHLNAATKKRLEQARQKLLEQTQ